MSDAAGIATLAVGALLGLGLAWRWRSMPAVLAIGGQAVAGALLALGGLAVQDDVNAASWVFGPIALAGLSALHARALFGRPGRSAA